MHPEETERRKPVWLALSELYLDTELDDDDLKRIALILFQSSYSTEELKDILYYEVAPIVRGNLWTVAGIWSGFDEDWLYKKIIEKTADKKRRKTVFAMIDRYWADLNPKSSWNKISSLIQELLNHY